MPVHALAATISFPDTITYDEDPDRTVTGPVSGAPYLFNDYQLNGGPALSFPFRAGPDGVYNEGIGFDPNDFVGPQLLGVATPDGKVEARKTGTLVGTSPYFRQSRLDG